MNLSILTFKNIALKYWLIWVMSVVTFFLSIINYFNYKVDPFNYHSDILDRNYSLNITKEKWLQNFPIYKLTKVTQQQAQTLIIGSSTVGCLSTTLLSHYIKAPAYNFYVPVLQTMDAYHYIKYIVKNSNLKTILYGLEFAGFNKSLNNSYTLNNSLKKFMNLNSLGLYRYLQNFSFYTLKASYASYQLIQHPHKKIDKIYLNNDGTLSLYKREQLDKLGQYDFKGRNRGYLKSFTHGDAYYMHYRFDEEQFKNLQKIKTLCDERGIDLKIFINPIHISLQNLIHSLRYENKILEFRTRLAKISNFTDFTLPNKITQDDSYFWDAAHYKTKMSPLIYDKLFLNKGDFGVNVKKLP